MSRPRQGTLSDADTLRLYEGGVHAQDIAEREGCTAGAILARVSRARAARNRTPGTRSANRPSSQPQVIDPYGFRALRAAVDRLAALESRHA